VYSEVERAECVVEVLFLPLFLRLPLWPLPALSGAECVVEDFVFALAYGLLPNACFCVKALENPSQTREFCVDAAADYR
jgi:hypothetical protein